MSKIPTPRNEPVLSYAPGSPERAALKAELARQSRDTIEIPVVVGGREIRTGRTINVVAPHNHKHVLAKVSQADVALIREAADTAVEAQRAWAAMGFEDRAAVFLKAAELLAGSWRPVVNAATMLGQSKTAFQAEIDSACELIDFWRFNVHYAERLYQEQPISSPGVWNRLDHRPLEGFVYAITPFNFTAIGGNLPTTPAILGNVVVWKPATAATLSNWYIFKLLEAAGLLPGVINFVPGSAAEVSNTLLVPGRNPLLAFPVFQSLWQTVGENWRLRSIRASWAKPAAGTCAQRRSCVAVAGAGRLRIQGQKCSAACACQTTWPCARKCST
jgi:1-pyrroline-5-carboxylate dehydrogenase